MPSRRPAWISAAREVATALREDHTSLTAAGVAFFLFVATIPTIAAVVSVYGLVADPDEVTEASHTLFESLPHDVRALLTRQLTHIATTGGGALSLSLALSIAAAIWSASSATAYLLEALHLTYGEPDRRGFLPRRLRALRYTVAGVVTAAAALWLIVTVSGWASGERIPSVVGWIGRIGALGGIGLFVFGALSVLYRHGAAGAANRRRVTPGALLAVVVWTAASVGFQVYTTNFGSYNETYGSLAAVVLAMLWLWISAFAVLAGAETNAVLEARGA